MTTTQLQNEIITSMRMHLKNDQISILMVVLAEKMKDVEIVEMETSLMNPDEYNKYIDMFIAAKAIEGCSKSTLKTYGTNLRKFAREIHIDLLKVNTNHIRVYLANVIKHGSTKVTQENIRLNLNTFYSWLSIEDYIGKNPCSKIKRIKQDKKLLKIFSADDIEKIRNECNTLREKALIELMISTGMRRAELTDIKMEDVDFEKRELTIFGKGSKERTGYINPKCYFTLKEYIENRGYESEYLICSTKSPHGKLSATAIEAIVKNVGERANVNRCIIHKFRHYFCSELCRRGMNLFYIQELMGHESIDTTKRIYTYINGENVKTEYRKYCA